MEAERVLTCRRNFRRRPPDGLRRSACAPHGRGKCPRASSRVALCAARLRRQGYPHMLVLSRRLSEKILFPGIQAAVQVVAIKPGVVRLGIQAPPEVLVMREEVLGRAASSGATATPPVQASLHLPQGTKQLL